MSLYLSRSLRTSYLIKHFAGLLILNDSFRDFLPHFNRIIFYRVDKRGFIYKQKCTVRVNCVDCLDRTNVVQMVLAKHMLENQVTI